MIGTPSITGIPVGVVVGIVVGPTAGESGVIGP